MDTRVHTGEPIQPPRLPDRLRLPFAFDPDLLQRDLNGLLSTTDWIAHFVKQNYEGDWSVIPLRAKAGATHPVMMIFSDPATKAFEDTPMLGRCPYVQEVLAVFQCPLLAVRLMQLAPGSVIKEHTDFDLDFDQGVVRIHIPIATNADVDFRLSRRRVVMDPGSSWYLRLSDPHSVANRGTTSRVHLVIDAVVNDWIAAILMEAARTAENDATELPAPLTANDIPADAPHTPLEQFCALVLDDVSLHDPLRDVDDIETFIALVRGMGQDRGFIFTDDDVRAAMRATSRVFNARSTVT